MTLSTRDSNSTWVDRSLKSIPPGITVEGATRKGEGNGDVLPVTLYPARWRIGAKKQGRSLLHLSPLCGATTRRERLERRDPVALCVYPEDSRIPCQPTSNADSQAQAYTTTARGSAL